MITEAQLKAKARSRYDSTLKRILLGENPFPLQIPYKRPRRTGDPSVIVKTKEFLRNQSKEIRGFGPVIQFDQTSTRRFGAGEFPGAVMFTSLEDLTRYIEKQAEAERILQNAGIITDAFPEVRQWTASRLRLLASRDATTWRGIVEIVSYFMQNPKPWIYSRELPLPTPTKLLEHNYAPVIEILSLVYPAALNDVYTTWQDRLGLRSSSDLIEGRFLDSTLAPHLPRHMLAPVKEWNRCAFPAPTWILITENRTTLFTLPNLSGCLALLGKGYAVTKLAEIDKLRETQIYYWGDIDQHGFEILASLRSHLNRTISCMMDEATLRKCERYVGKEEVEGTLPEKFVSQHLTPVEQLLWNKCSQYHHRLEQEHIPNSVSFPILEQLGFHYRDAISVQISNAGKADSELTSSE